MGKLSYISLDSLSDDVISEWHQIRHARPDLDSPFFHPGFSAAVHAAMAPVDVAIAHDDSGSISGLFPLHRVRSRIRPVGWPAADFQGPVVAPGSTFPVRSLFSGRVKSLEFDHLSTGVSSFTPWIESEAGSPHVDTSGGLDGYMSRASRSGKDNMAQARRRLEKARRELGEIRFCADVKDDAALERVIALKRLQYRATGARDYFSVPSRRVLLARLMHDADDAFGGVLSTLSAGDHLLAAHFGLRDLGVLHWWFPVYDVTYASLSPGWMLLRELVSCAPTFGFTRIDLGRGDDEYKRRAKTGESTVYQGYVTSSGARRAARSVQRSTRSLLKSSGVVPRLRGVYAQARRRLSG